jgi:hypothetical protein
MWPTIVLILALAIRQAVDLFGRLLNSIRISQRSSTSKRMELDMKSIVIRQVIVFSLLVTVMCVAMLVGTLLILNSEAATHTGTMLIAPPYQHLHIG